MSETPSVDVVIPTVGRPTLRTLLEALAAARGPCPRRVLVVDDTGGDAPLPAVPGLPYERLRGPGRGPAAARNAGWRRCDAEWVAFLDDDVVPSPEWLAHLARDLAAAGEDVAASQGRIVVPLSRTRPATDWERNVAGLERARWPTADIAYRRRVLTEVGGFDERFRRAYREDAELALRVEKAGYRLARGTRTVEHPVRPARPWASLTAQKGNADDVLLERLHPGWRRHDGEPRGRRARHVATTAAGAAALAAWSLGRRRTAALASAAWILGSGELALARILPGPRTAGAVAAMLATSVALPAAATAWWLLGLVRWRGVRPLTQRPAAVLLDRDGTLVADVPYNGDPDRVVPMPGAREALDRLRALGIPTAVVSNQSGIGR
ncbi:MAG: glycosyltransferase, partial [Thermoleophilia bacterium]|nr:glycosyltransferase [Thermoleophilia bacterium]